MPSSLNNLRTWTNKTVTPLKVWQLKYCAFLTGAASTGTKAKLEDSLVNSLSNITISKDRYRILSVDMGIRNLAYCVLDVQLPQSRRQQPKSIPLKPFYRVEEWQRFDVLAKPGDGPSPTVRQARKEITNEAFTPSALSKIAYKITQKLLAHRPDVILIERQRFRSGGASAIQEWTVRVNMLESMLWACLETLRHNSSLKSSEAPDVQEISPKRVGSFWTADGSIDLGVPDDIFCGPHDKGDTDVLKGVKTKVEKKDKIAVLKSWLKGDGGVDLDFSPAVKETVGSFGVLADLQSGNNVAGPRKRVPASKLDDLTDCMLQAMAWVRWEENSRKLRRLGDFS